MMNIWHCLIPSDSWAYLTHIVLPEIFRIQSRIQILTKEVANPGHCGRVATHASCQEQPPCPPAYNALDENDT